LTYEIRWSHHAFRKFEKLDGQVRKQVTEKLEGIVDDPFVAAKRLSGTNLYSLRVGDYRVIMSVERGRMLILVIDLGHRSKRYKKL
jgi:mRNA interferase RelE/StbE